VTAPRFGSQPRSPVLRPLGLEPHCRTSRCARPQSTPSPRYHHLLPLLHCRILRTARWPVTAPPSDGQPRSPVPLLLRLGTPPSNLPVRAPTAGAFTEVLPTQPHCGTATCTCGTAHGGRRSRRATRCGRQSRRRPATTLASGLHQRTVPPTATSCTAPGSSSLPGPAVSLGYERNHNHTRTQCLLQLP